MPTDEKALLWRAGRLRYLLKPNQREVYDAFHAWNNKSIASRAAGEPSSGRFPRLFCLDAGRRFGKDFISILLLLEKALQTPNGVFLYASAAQKDISDIANILLPQIVADCPMHLRPMYKASFRGHAEGIYLPHNNAMIKLVGLDLRPDGIRGRHCDGAGFSECSFIKDLSSTIESVLEPQMLGRSHAFLLANSTPGEAGGAAWDTDLCPDARDRGAYVLRTIWDSHYSEAEKFEFLKLDRAQVEAVCRARGYSAEERMAYLRRGADGLVKPKQQREYLCVRVREETKVVIPEFTKAVHVAIPAIPEYAHAYTVIDPGVQDLCAINFCVWDFANHKLLVLDEFARRNANTNEIVDVIRKKEQEHYTSLRFWNGKGFAENPYQRVSDVDARLIQDLNTVHGIRCAPARKDDALAALHALRNAFQANHIVIHPRCVNTIEHLEGAIWNKSRTSYERSERLGHCDLIDSLKYAWRHVARSANPNPPHGVIMQALHNSDKLHVKPGHLTHGNSVAQKMASLFPNRWRKR